MQTRDSIEVGHETADVPVRPLLVALFLLLLVCAGTFWLMRSLFDSFLARKLAQEPLPHPMAGAQPTPEGPLLQVDSDQELRAYLEAQRDALGRYEWLDRDAGIVRLPVERALELVLREGLPVRVEVEEGAR